MKRFIATAMLASVAFSAQAASNIDNLGSLAQPTFRLLSEDLSSALSYKALAPAEPLGITGFDIGVEMTTTKLANSDAFAQATTGTSLSALPVPKLHLHKGLPFGIDVGAFYSSVPSTNIKLMGAELRYAFLEGGVALPAVAVRGTYTKLSGVDQLAFSTRGLELTASKGFAMLTPYAGVGKVWADSTPDAATGLTAESITQNKMFVGLNTNLGLMNIALEGDKTGDATSYGLKLGIRW